jgi:hypothetical protein
VVNISGEKPVILVRNVSANADGIQAVQPGFLAASATAVSENVAVADQEHAGDELFASLVVLRFTPVEVHEPRRGGDDGQGSFNVEAQPLKHPQRFEQLSFKAENSFFRCHSLVCLSCAENHGASGTVFFQESLLAGQLMRYPTGYSHPGNDGCLSRSPPRRDAAPQTLRPPPTRG